MERANNVVAVLRSRVPYFLQCLRPEILIVQQLDFKGHQLTAQSLKSDPSKADAIQAQEGNTYARTYA